MKTKNYLTLAVLMVISTLTYAQEDTSNKINTELKTLLNFNNLGNDANYSNLSPEIFLGFTDVMRNYGNKNRFILEGGPYFSSQIDIKDSTAYLPALMLPGSLGAKLNIYHEYGDTGSNSKFISSIGGGLKVLSNFVDTGNSIMQYNLRASLSYQYKNFLGVSMQYTFGWHDLTSSAEANFENTFTGLPDKVEYINVGVSFRLSQAKSDANTYFMLNWRSFIGNSELRQLPNSRILGFSLRRDIGVGNNNTPNIKRNDTDKDELKMLSFPFN